MEEKEQHPIKIVVPYGPSQRNDGAAMYMIHAFNRLKGVVAERAYYLPGSSNEGWPKADAYVDIDWAQDAFAEVADIPCRHPHIWWCSDAHVSQQSFDWRFKRAIAADVTLVFQKKHGQMFAQGGLKKPIHWFPTAAEHTCFTPILKDYNNLTSPRMHLPPIPEAWAGRFVKRVPKYDWCFVGHINNDRRIVVLDQLSKAYPNWLYGKAFFEECAQIFGSAKIVFNVCHDGDINLRFFEALSCRVCQLTEWLPEYEELGFRHKEHCLFYKTFDEAVELMGEYLDPSKDQERDEIAERGWRKTWAEHTYDNRARDIVSLMQLYGMAPVSPELLAILNATPPPQVQP